MGIEATIISFAPCLVRNGLAGVSLENNLISIIPELIKIAPTGVNVRTRLLARNLMTFNYNNLFTMTKYRVSRGQ